MIKPTPFCLLDEIDAPLDDANINRFIELVKEFSKEFSVYHDHPQSQEHHGSRPNSLRDYDGDPRGIESRLGAVELEPFSNLLFVVTHHKILILS